MEQDLLEQVLQVEDLVPAVKEQEPNPEDLPPHKTILEGGDAVVVLVGVVDRDAEFSLQIFLVMIRATTDLNTDHTKDITRIRAENIY
ncbi:MAG: hypothetical protein C4B58_07130 [Deltaproteobacteria bacterium]|nr:MAG: hypothetical protein C4B58_07130 [Deltaproteobacteria bacterium]